jgi:hypothetical protein
MKALACEERTKSAEPFAKKGPEGGRLEDTVLQAMTARRA